MQHMHTQTRTGADTRVNSKYTAHTACIHGQIHRFAYTEAGTLTHTHTCLPYTPQRHPHVYLQTKTQPQAGTASQACTRRNCGAPSQPFRAEKVWPPPSRGTQIGRGRSSPLPTRPSHSWESTWLPPALPSQFPFVPQVPGGGNHA